MFCEIFKPEQRLALTGEGYRHPTEWVIEIPDCDTHASIDLNTGSHGLNHCKLVLPISKPHGQGTSTYIMVGLVLLLQVGVVNREVNAHVQLSQGHLNPCLGI